MWLTIAFISMVTQGFVTDRYICNLTLYIFFRDCKEVEIDGKGSDPMLQEQLYQASLKWIQGSHQAIAKDNSQGDVTDVPTMSKDRENTASESTTRSRKMERVEIWF